jgi:hypothetical protein
VTRCRFSITPRLEALNVRLRLRDEIDQLSHELGLSRESKRTG